MEREDERRRLKALEMTKERTVTSSESTTTTVRRNIMERSPPSVGQDEADVSGGVTSLAKSVKNTVIGFLTPTKDSSLTAIVESSESGFEDGNLIGEQTSTPGTKDRFRPAREFFAEADSRERLNSDFFSGSDTPSKLRESTRRLSIRKPFNKYIAYSSDEEYDEWRDQPKSDYTYSTSLSYRSRVTPDRKIGSPNMSRRTLKGGVIDYMGSPDFTTTATVLENDATSSSTSYDLRSRTILKTMDALSDTSDGEEVVEQQVMPRLRRSTRSRSIEVPRSNGSLSRTVTTTTTEYTTTRALHYGLDAESDVEDNTKSVVPDRATPLLGRGGTPLGRAVTPLASLKISSSRKSSSASIDGGKGFALDGGKGYTIGEATIAEDVEEEDEETQGNMMWRWSRKTIEVITRMTTIITASVAMMATQAVTAVASSTSSKEKIIEVDEKASKLSTTELISIKYQAFCERIRKNPILLWIPLLLILLLLALAAYWWLLQSKGETAAGASDLPTENGEPSSSFFLTFLAAMQYLASGISSLLASAWSSTTSAIGMPLSFCQAWLSTLCTYTMDSFIWLGSSTLSLLSWLWQWIILGFTFLLNLPFLAFDGLKYLAVGAYGALSSTGTYLFGILPFASSNDSGLEKETDSQKVSFSLISWFSNLSPAEQLSGAYVAVGKAAQSSGTVLWHSWLWLVNSIGEILLSSASLVLLGLSSIMAAFLYILTGLWMMVTYVWLTLVGILWTLGTALSSLVPKASEPVAIHITKEAAPQPPVVNISLPKTEDLILEVLDSEKFKSIIAAAIGEKMEGQLTVDDVYAAAKSVVEGELGIVREEIASLKTEVDRNSASSAEQHKKILLLQEEKANLIKELSELGQRLYNVEGKIEVADAKALQDRGEIEGQIEQVIQQINKLEVDHANLAADVKSCCDDKKVPAILGRIFGLTSINGEEETDQPDIGAWMKSYFVAKDELAAKLEELTANMQVKPADEDAQATVTQTTQLVMGAVLAKLQEEMTKQHQQYSEEVDQKISAQVNSQVTEAASVLKDQILQQIIQHVEVQNVEMKSGLEENVNSAVLGRVQAAVDIAVDKAIASVVSTAVPSAVEKSVPEAVRDILPTMVAEEVASSVPEVVASAVPAAVTSAVSEAMVHVSESQAGGHTTENEVRNEVVGITGSASVNLTGNGDNLFAPGMHLPGLNETEVLKIVQNALRKYDADKTGMVDHALESAGGNIISTRCTENYQVRQAELVVLGFSIYRYSTNSPRTVIQPDALPGQCWAFKGSQGYIVIQLAGEVKPTGFTLEHIPKELSPNGAIDSAPRKFEVWGLMAEADEGILLGSFEYLENGDPLQYFPVTVDNQNYFPLVELKINSNHGNLNYTCLYRFRVHGVRYL